jgi:hypothetical protein
MSRVRRPRTSTLVLIGLFLAVFALYLLVRPVQATGGTTKRSVGSVSATSSPAQHHRPHRHRATPTPTATRPHTPRATPSAASPSPSPSASPSPTVGATATPSATASPSATATG